MLNIGLMQISNVLFRSKTLETEQQSSFPNKKVQYLFARALGDKKE